MKIFAETQLSGVLEGHRHKLHTEVQSEAPNKLLNVNESDYVKYLAEKYRIEPPVIDFDALQVSAAEKLIPVEQHPLNYAAGFSDSGPAAFPRQVITFHLPFSGDVGLLKCQPSSWIGWTTEISASHGEISFEIVNWQTDDVKREQGVIVDRIRQQNQNITAEVMGFNSSLEARARQEVTARKSALFQQMRAVESLGIPLRKSSGVPPTFAVPVVPKRLPVKPAASGGTYAAEPTLDHATYQDILSIIHDTGVAMERSPSTYASKQEEDLRDFFLMTLCTHYPNTTGETFNKQGKTDILVRHQGANAFVGECKFWKGLKGYFDTIDQILGYLTWRDSKAAIVCFVNNKELNPVLEQISAETSKHPCFVRLESKLRESWTQFEFRLKSDPTRNVHLAVLCFHFP